jgi:hypothetical protein
MVVKEREWMSRKANRSTINGCASTSVTHVEACAITASHVDRVSTKIALVALSWLIVVSPTEVSRGSSRAVVVLILISKNH